MTAKAIAAAFESACFAELQALKPGNVHIHADGHGMTVADFEASARAAAPYIAEEGRAVGERIFWAVRATYERLAQNTNLGIVLLCVPLAVAWERATGKSRRVGQPRPTAKWANQPGGCPASDKESAQSDKHCDALRQALRDVLKRLDQKDAILTFRAIALANPGGLGQQPEHDVRTEPEISLIEAMRLAASRDRIAYQYATAFADVFEVGLPIADALAQSGATDAYVAERVYWCFLTHFPDSHIARKYGPEKAAEICMAARALDSDLMAASEIERKRLLLGFDAWLKADEINPGTSADLTVSTLFTQKLRALRA
jgi:triphosphoribosyl-dephospho-CoA synthase